MALRRVTLRPRVVTAKDVRADSSLEEDPYLGKVSRYIPAEIVAAYIAASGIVLGSTGVSKLTWLWIVIAVLGVLTPVWLYFATKVEGKPPATFQIVVGTVAYLVWVFALSGGELFGWYNPIYGGLLLILFTLLVPLIEKILNQ